jgi:hypothetical protein
MVAQVGYSVAGRLRGLHHTRGDEEREFLG